MSLSFLLPNISKIYAAYLVISLLTERLFTKEYFSQGSSQGSRFHYADLPAIVSSVCCLCYSQMKKHLAKENPNPIPRLQVLYLGILYATNIIALNTSLFYISYPTRVVGDKCGYLTAVLVAVYFSRNSRSPLSPRKIKIALLITAGTLIFALLRQNQHQYKEYQEEWKGYLLLLLSISCEALFSDSQKYVKSQYNPSKDDLMSCVNLMTLLIATVHLIINGKVWESIEFCWRHPETIAIIGVCGVLQVMGQCGIYAIVLNCRQHMFALISTTRKVFTVLLSIFYYNHDINGYQWAALVMVFGGMLYEMIDQLYVDSKRKIKKHLSAPPILQKQQ